MLTCRGCMRRYLQNLIGDSSISFPPSLSRTLAATVPSSQASRRSSTVAFSPPVPSAGSASHSSADRDAGPPSPRWKDRQRWLESRGVRPAHKPAATKDADQAFVVRKHLKYLKDPLKLAEQVRKFLRDDDFETTLALVRAASKDIQCTVSWNHLIEWQLSKGKMNAAIKTYNEMKKRSQVPDARTYTIIFSGCANHPDTEHALAKVISIYQSMLTEKSLIKPNTIHMNAVLKMCARAQNMDALFAIADKMPAKGLRAPNNLTYTTIINALRISAVNDLRSTLDDKQKRENRRKAILQARVLWADVVQRWRQGDMWIDEELVCAMGRILLVGETQDNDDILSLVEQAMNIPRQVPRKGTPERALIEPGSQGKRTARPDQSQMSASNEAEPETAADEDIASAERFEPVTLTKSPSPATNASYARPGPNTLSLLMQCLLNLRLKEPASRYWKLLTKEYGLKPDSDNYHAYLRILRYARASAETLELLLEMPTSYMQSKTFRIAMSACERDKNNRNAFPTSGKILDIMETNLKVPDIFSLTRYLDLAVTAPAYSPKVSSNGESVQSKTARGRQILRALSRLGPNFLNLRSLLSYGLPTHSPTVSEDEAQKESFWKSMSSKAKSKKAEAEFKNEVLVLTRRLVGAHDILIRDGLVPKSMWAELAAQRSKLAAFITRFKNNARPVDDKPVRSSEQDKTSIVTRVRS